MAKIDDVEFGITAKLTVSNETVDRCLRILEWWQNDHAEQYILADTKADGSIHFYRKLKNDTTTSD